MSNESQNLRKMHGVRIISSYDKGKKAYGSSLAILSVRVILSRWTSRRWPSFQVVKKEEGHWSLYQMRGSTVVIPDIAFILRKPYLGQYGDFVIRLDGTHMHISKAVVPRTYLELFLDMGALARICFHRSWRVWPCWSWWLKSRCEAYGFVFIGISLIVGRKDFGKSMRGAI